MAASRVGDGPGLVDEHQALRAKIELAVEPVTALPQYVGAVLLDCMAGLYGMAHPFSSASDMMPVLENYVAKLPSCVIAMEACCGAQHLGRLFAAQGHEFRLMSPE